MFRSEHGRRTQEQPWGSGGPGRGTGAMSGGNVSKDKWGKQALSPAPPATGGGVAHCGSVKHHRFWKQPCHLPYSVSATFCTMEWFATGVEKALASAISISRLLDGCQCLKHHKLLLLCAMSQAKHRHAQHLKTEHALPLKGHVQTPLFQYSQSTTKASTCLFDQHCMQFRCAKRYRLLTLLSSTTSRAKT